MWIDNASDIDVLFYEPYADVISEMALNKEYKPLTIGVFGVWGAGKSTLLKLVEQKITIEAPEKKQTICVNINAWSFEGYEDAKVAVMESLLQELKKEAPDTIKTKIKKLLKKVDFFKLTTKAVGITAPIAASVVAGNPLPMIMSFNGTAEEIGKGIKKASEVVQTIREDYIKDDTDVSEESSIVNNVRTFRKEFEDALNDNNLDNVVVLIDDLDRCQPERIIETLEAIKLFLSVNKTTFIIAADENVIQYAIRKKYPPVNNTEVNLDREYIEKIIQLPIYIPELSTRDIENYLMFLVVQQYSTREKFLAFIQKVKEKNIMVSQETIDKGRIYELSEEYIEANEKTIFNYTAGIIAGIKNIVAETLKGNPRQAKRFLNTFMTKRKLAAIYYGAQGIDEIVLAKVLTLQKLNPELFRKLNDWNKSFDGENEEFKKMRVAVTTSDTEQEEYKEWYIPAIAKWLNCPPIELENIPLDKYFYLTREGLNKSEISESALSMAAKEILQRLLMAKQGLMVRIVADMRQMSALDQDNILQTIFPKIEKGELQIFIIRDLFINFEAYRNRFFDALSKSQRKVTVGDIPAFKEMRKKDIEKMDSLLNKWEASGVLDEKTKNRIQKEGK